jgi:hypothetical protein
MKSLEKEFLEYIAEQIFPGNVHPVSQYWTFRERFNPNNYTLENVEIAKGLHQMQPDKDYVSGINQHIKEVIKKINRVFGNELANDGISADKLGLGDKKGTPGRKKSQKESPWQIIYQWLWNIKYPRWSQDYIWDSWKNRAEKSREWIQFSDRLDGSKAMVIPAPKPKETLPINTPLNLAIDVDSPGSYILLFNRGRDKKEDKVTKYLVAPSQAFAPSYELSSKVTLMPQKDSIMHEYGINFDAESEEEYLGIVIDDPLDLPWLNPDPENPVLEWKGEHLNELWEKLHRRGNWQVFYRDFKVVA